MSTLQKLENRLTAVNEEMLATMAEVQAAAEEGDLRENALYSASLAKYDKLRKEKARLEEAKKTMSGIPVDWHPPTEIGDMIVMGVLIDEVTLDKPVVILPTFLAGEYPDTAEYYVCSTDADFAIKYLGNKVSESTLVRSIRRWQP